MKPVDFERFFHAAPAGYVVTATDGTIVEVNETFSAWVGTDRTSLLGSSFLRILPVGERIMYGTHAMARLDEVGFLAELSTELLGVNRARIPVLLSITRQPATEEHPATDWIVASRATERRLHERELVAALRGLQEAESARNRLLDEARQQALHDPLTGLANRALLQRSIRDALMVAASTGEKVGLLFCDVNRFKRINDSLGHTAGDEVLRHVAACLIAAAGFGNIVARYSGDEFVVLVPAVNAANELDVIEDRIRLALAPPAKILGRDVTVDVAVGSARADPEQHGSEEALLSLATQLIDDADAAMYRSKARSRGKPLERIHLPERIRLETDLRGAAGRGELTVHYQPQFDAETGTIVGAEALVRWQHPELGLLTPAAFIDIAEESDLIEEVGEFVLHSACTFGAQLRREGHALEISVNVSANQLTNPRFEPFIGATLAVTDFPGDALTLEITESRVISEAVINNGALENIRRLGVGLSVDDFGTGYSSLYQLRHLPVTEVKIDRSFISSISDEGSLAFVAGIVSLGHGLSLRVVAEGVERPGQLTVLRGTGCDRLQGYHLGRPVEESEFRGLLATGPSPGQPGWPSAGGRDIS